MPRFALTGGFDVPEVIQSEHGYHFRHRQMTLGSRR